MRDIVIKFKTFHAYSPDGEYMEIFFQNFESKTFFLNYIGEGVPGFTIKNPKIYFMNHAPIPKNQRYNENTYISRNKFLLPTNSFLITSNTNAIKASKSYPGIEYDWNIIEKKETLTESSIFGAGTFGLYVYDNFSKEYQILSTYGYPTLVHSPTKPLYFDPITRYPYRSKDVLIGSDSDEYPILGYYYFIRKKITNDMIQYYQSIGLSIGIYFLAYDYDNQTLIPLFDPNLFE